MNELLLHALTVWYGSDARLDESMVTQEFAAFFAAHYRELAEFGPTLADICALPEASA